MRNTKSLINGCAGFSLLEALIALVILSGGLLALATVFSQGLIIISTAHYHQAAKELASEAVECVFTSRDTKTITWDDVRNESNGGQFVDDLTEIKDPGPDGLVNTLDDGDIKYEWAPGPDGVLGTGDDIPITNFHRQIEITDVSPNLRQIRVIISYHVGHLNRQYELVTYISSFA
jgi:hypothetical protein